MKEYKFRVWDKELSAMVYFDFGDIDDGRTFAGEGMVNLLDAEIMQYTGLKDIKGEEIYEGDILEYDDGHGKQRWEVERSTGLDLIDGTMQPEKWVIGFVFPHYEVEIVGNIEEKPGCWKGNRNYPEMTDRSI